MIPIHYYRVQNRHPNCRYWWFRRWVDGHAHASEMPTLVVWWMVHTFPRPRRPWLRTWQAEWDGCQHAVRAFTRRGIERKAIAAATADITTYRDGEQ